MANRKQDEAAAPAADTQAVLGRAASPASVPAGLSSEEARGRLDKYGPNDPAPPRHGATAAELLFLLLNPLVVILLVASIVSAVLGQRVDAAIITLIVLISVAINFLQTYRSRRAMEDLREHVTLTATVLRDDEWVEIGRREVVPGDVVRLSAGDLVPADGRLLESRDLFVQQAALTGESMPAEKQAALHSGDPEFRPDSPSHVFLGTSVVSGTGTALILATGAQTAFGAVAARMAARPQETEFEHSLRSFALLITRAVLFLVLFIVVVRLALHKDAFESFVFAVALAVGLTPEFLPMISTVTLARGAVRMARRKVVVKRLAAIQNFGSIDVLCSDKTGTITTGEMSLVSSVDYLGRAAQRPLELAYLNSKFETGIRSPLDTAVLRSERAEGSSWRKCDEIPFDFSRRRLSVVVQAETGKPSSYLMITKGAPEGLLEICDFCEDGGQTRSLDARERENGRQTYRSLSGEGFRVLAIAYRAVDSAGGFTIADERALTLAGFLTFADPPRPDAAASITAMKRDGVQVKILTGDNELVARHICAQVGLEAPSILLGDHIDEMTDPALAHLAEETTVFARVSPVQKHRIIQALKQRGHVVGYIGDGINDAPSLHAADVGISVPSAADVARDAAEVILLEQGLGILHSGIREGRRASANVMKYLLMGTSSNFGNMFSMAAASVFLPFLPMLSTQILLNNFLYDAAQITIPSDRVDAAALRSPNRWDIRLIRNFMIFVGPISSLYDFLTFYVLLHFFHAGVSLFHTGWFVESLATQTLVLFVIRTAGNPLVSRPSRLLTVTTLLVVGLGCWLPFSPLAGILGFVPLPRSYFAFLAVSTVTYLLVVEIAKRRLLARPMAGTGAQHSRPPAPQVAG